MAKIIVDVTDVEAGGGGEQPQPGLYNGKIVSITPREKKASGEKVHDMEIVVDVGQEYARLWTYVKLPGDEAFDRSKWKLREFLDAIGSPPKVEITPQKIKSWEGKPVLVKVGPDTDLEGEYRGRVKNLFLPGSKDDDNIVSSGTGSGGDDDYSEWTDDDLKAELKEQGLSVSGRWSREKAIEALGGSSEPEAETEAAGDVPEVPEVPEELVPDLFDDPADYEGWPDDDIKGYVADLDDLVNIEGRYSRQKAIAALVALAQAYHGTGDGGGSEPEPEPDEPTDEFDTWNDQELKDEVLARNEQGADIKVSGRWTRDKAIEALRADDAANSGDPF